MRPLSLVLAVIAALSGCADRLPSPTSPRSDPQDYRRLAAWFSERGVVLPAELPAREPAAKAATDHEEEKQRHLGDVDGNGVLNFWDLWPLWHYLTGFTYLASYYDFDLLDIDRDGDNDWDDLKYFGEFLYGGASENPWRIGFPLGPSIRASLSPDPEETRFTSDGTLWHRFTLQVQTASGDSSDCPGQDRRQPRGAFRSGRRDLHRFLGAVAELLRRRARRQDEDSRPRRHGLPRGLPGGGVEHSHPGRRWGQSARLLDHRGRGGPGLGARGHLRHRAAVRG